jgi:hypothetical protein
MSPVNGDILSASSLLLAAVAAFYTLWYSEICSARDIEVKTHRDDRDPQISVVASALKTKALPLSISIAIIVLVFAPNVIDIVITSASAFYRSPGNALAHYSAVRTAFVAIWIFELGLLSSSCLLVRGLRKKLSKLRRPNAKPGDKPKARRGGSGLLRHSGSIGARYELGKNSPGDHKDVRPTVAQGAPVDDAWTEGSRGQ